MLKRHVFENDGVVLEHIVLIISTLNGLTLDRLNVILKLFPLLCLELREVALDEFQVLTGEGGDLGLDLGVEKELHCTFVVRLDLTDAMLFGYHSCN
jgi:hypothetical protein